MSAKKPDPNRDRLFSAILSLQTAEECDAFFEDLCTATELRDMTQRFAVAGMLRQKRVFSDIAKETGASTATISRVNRALHYGSDGYQLVFDRLEQS